MSQFADMIDSNANFRSQKMPPKGLVIILIDFFITLAGVAGAIYFLSAFAGTTGNPNDITKASQFLWLYFGLPVVVFAALVAAYAILHKK